MTERLGVMKVVREVLQDNEALGMTLSQIMDRADIPKTRAAEVSSALGKLIKKGLIGVVEGPAVSTVGRRVVRSYAWTPPVVVVLVVEQQSPNPLAALGIFRI
jgi:hypothetical protein